MNGAPNPAATRGDQDDIATLARGGRTNVLGFLLRLGARIPFLFIGGRIYGAAALGRFAYAVLIVEFAAQLASLGLKRGLAGVMIQTKRPESHVVADALLLTFIASLLGVAVLVAFPQVMYPNSDMNGLDRLLPLLILAVAGADVGFAACAWRFDIASSVRVRAIVEPWTLSIGALLFSFYSLRDGLILAYVLSVLVALLGSFRPLYRHFGLPRGWRPHPMRLWRMARRNMPLAAADALEWGSRRLDLAMLGLFVSPATVGIYYVAQQVASLPQKLKSSFEPILGPVITRNLREGNLGGIARQVNQVGFWIVAAQAGIALSLGIPGKAVMGLVGPNFAGGAMALAFLLAAEVIASTAVVSESALVYMARLRNLAISLVTIGLQAGLTFLFLLSATRAGHSELMTTVGPALALAIALGISSLAKAVLLARLLGHRVATWRPALLLASAVATAVGSLFLALPHHLEWVVLMAGVPLTLFSYCYVIWRFGFGPEDRSLFRSQAPVRGSTQ